MPQYFSIARTVSAKGKKAQIICNFHGKSVTRHIIDGVGKHPDDNVPRVNQRMREDIADCERGINNCIQTNASLAKRQDAEAKDLVVRTAQEKAKLEARLLSIQTALASFEKEDPLMVRYE